MIANSAQGIGRGKDPDAFLGYRQLHAVSYTPVLSGAAFPVQTPKATRRAEAIP